MALLSVRDLSIRYDSVAGPVHAVEHASFDIESGESVGIVGESACGKSTLGLGIMQSLSGGSIIGGSIIFDGRNINDMSDAEFEQKYRWKQISMMFQGAMNSLDPVYTIQEQFTEILQHHKSDDVILDTITAVNLDESVLRRYPHELSGGMKQRVIIAMALLLKPRLVIADEPTTALDVLIQARIINMLKDLKKSSGMSFLFITHDLALLSEIADKVGIMYGGQLVEFGTSENVYNSPQHPYTKKLLESIPRLHGPQPSYIPGTPPNLLAPPTTCRFVDRCPDAMKKCQNDPPDFAKSNSMVKCWLYE